MRRAPVTDKEYIFDSWIAGKVARRDEYRVVLVD